MKKVILVIEDEANIRSNIEQILSLADYQVVEAENGAVGLDIAFNIQPSLIICDIMMPQMDGYEVLMALRQNENTNTIPIIFLTAKSAPTDFRQGMDLGADDYLTKPFTPEELLKAIETRFQRQANYEAVLQVQINQEKQKLKQIQQEILDHQSKFNNIQQIATLRDEMLKKIMHDLSNPISNINLAITLLQQADTPEKREKYINILKVECEREISILNELVQLQNLLTPENLALLQSFDILKR